MKKKIVALMMTAALALSMVACGGAAASEEAAPAAEAPAAEASADVAAAPAEGGQTFKIGICNYVDDASLNQIVANIESQLDAISAETGVTFEINYDNCNADAAVMDQIIANFIADEVDLMIGVATPVAMAMQAATEENQIPVVFSAVSDPLAVGLVDTLEVPGANITGTSDFLNTDAIMNLILAQNPDIDTIGLLYDMGQDSSATPIAAAKAFCEAKGIKTVEHTGTNVSEVMLAADSFAADGVSVVFTPTDNTIMEAELSIYETLANAGIQHYCGADSFALNGAFLGYGVDYAYLGVETANIVKTILVDGKNPAEVPVMTFDNGIASINTETTEALGLDLAAVKAAFEPYCTQIIELQTAEEFE